MAVPRIVISKLNELLNRNYDSEFGYKESINLVSDQGLIGLFKTFAERRYHFRHDLQGEILRLGGTYDENINLLRDIERFWMHIKTAIARNNERAVVAECRKIEMGNWEHYNEALAMKELSEQTRTMLENHIANIDEVLYQLMEIENEYVIHH